MDLMSVISSFSTGTYTVTRSTPSAYGTDGRLDPPVTSTFDIRASVQPLNGRDLQRLPEGLRTMDLKTVFTASELLTQGPGQDPDTISIDGVDWEVQNVQGWGTLGAYFKAIVSKIGH